MLDPKAMGAACKWFDAEFNGQPDTQNLVSGIITAYLDALLPVWQTRGDGWQLIETCPGEKDVTYWGYGNGSQFVFYVGEHKGERRFYLDEADGYYRAYPTHWMTLPAPPQGKVP